MQNYKLISNTCRKIIKHQSRNIAQYVPRRSLLYVPSSDPKKLDKISSLSADCIAMDFEDGVAFNQKLQARDNAVAVLNNGKPKGSKAYELSVRVNAVSTPFFKYDLNGVLSANNWPESIVLPKCDTPDDIKLFADESRQYCDDSRKKFELIIFIESPLAIVNLVDIVRTALSLEEAGNFHVACLGFGGDDFIASLGAHKSDNWNEIIYARQKLVLVAKAFELQALDAVCINYKDLKLLMEQSKQASDLGYTGKQIIHPDQISVVHDAFMPSDERVEWATSLLNAFEEHQQRGVV